MGRSRKIGLTSITSGDGSFLTPRWRKEDSNSQSHLNKKLSEGARSVPPASGDPPASLTPSRGRRCSPFLDGEPAGFALFHPRFSTWLSRHGVYLEDLFVTQAARGKGVGRRRRVDIYTFDEKGNRLSHTRIRRAKDLAKNQTERLSK